MFLTLGEMLSIFSPLRIMFVVGLPCIAFILLMYVPSSWETDGERVETVSDFIFWGSKIMQIMTAAMKLKDAYSLEGKL